MGKKECLLHRKGKTMFTINESEFLKERFTDLIDSLESRRESYVSLMTQTAKSVYELDEEIKKINGILLKLGVKEDEEE